MAQNAGSDSPALAAASPAPLGGIGRTTISFRHRGQTYISHPRQAKQFPQERFSSLFGASKPQWAQI